MTLQYNSIKRQLQKYTIVFKKTCVNKDKDYFTLDL